MKTNLEPVFGPEGPKTYHERVLAARRNMRRRADAPVKRIKKHEPQRTEH